MARSRATFTSTWVMIPRSEPRDSAESPNERCHRSCGGGSACHRRAATARYQTTSGCAPAVPDPYRVIPSRPAGTTSSAAKSAGARTRSAIPRTVASTAGGAPHPPTVPLASEPLSADDVEDVLLQAVGVDVVFDELQLLDVLVRGAEQALARTEQQRVDEQVVAVDQARVLEAVVQGSAAVDDDRASLGLLQ